MRRTFVKQKRGMQIRKRSGLRVKRSCLLAPLALHNLVDCVNQFIHLSRLGKHKTGKGCLYIKNLDDVDRKVLKELIARSVAEMRKRYVCD